MSCRVLKGALFVLLLSEAFASSVSTARDEDSGYFADDPLPVWTKGFVSDRKWDLIPFEDNGLFCRPADIDFSKTISERLFTPAVCPAPFMVRHFLHSLKILANRHSL